MVVVAIVDVVNIGGWQSALEATVVVTSEDAFA